MDFKSYFDKFDGKRILVIGDVMVDAYIRGKVNRVSPEAPVPIVSFDFKEDRLGGAGNVALNLVALGAIPVLCSVIGKDADAQTLTNLLTENQVSSEGLVSSFSRKTTVKTRVVGNNQQLLRIDSEQTDPITSDEEDKLIERVIDLIKNGVDGIIFEDYNKGVLTERVISTIVDCANEYNVVTAVDPKKDNFFAYKNVSLFKPNLKELKEGLDVKFSFPADKDAFEVAVMKLESTLNNKISFVTLSEHGVFIKENGTKFYKQAHLRNIADVSGAGDTVISVAALCLVVGLPIEFVAEIANISGGLVCEESGVVPINKNQLLIETIKLLSK